MVHALGAKQRNPLLTRFTLITQNERYPLNDSQKQKSQNSLSDHHLHVPKVGLPPTVISIIINYSLHNAYIYLTTLITSKPSNTSVSIAASCSIFVGRNTFGAITVAKFELSILLPNRTTVPVIGDRMSSACLDTVPKNFNNSYNVSRWATGSNCIRCEMASNCKRLLRISTTTKINAWSNTLIYNSIKRKGWIYFEFLKMLCINLCTTTARASLGSTPLVATQIREARCYCPSLLSFRCQNLPEAIQLNLVNINIKKIAIIQTS